MLCCSGTTFYIMTLKSVQAKERYPAVNCEDVKKHYDTDIDKWRKESYMSYTINHERI